MPAYSLGAAVTEGQGNITNLANLTLSVSTRPDNAAIRAVQNAFC